MPIEVPVSAPFSDTSASPAPDCLALVQAAESALSAYGQDPSSRQTLRDSRIALRAVSEQVLRFSRQDRDAVPASAARQLVRIVSASGVHDHAVEEADLAVLAVAKEKGWPGLLAAMLVTPAWQWPQAPALDVVPDWLWGDYSAWLFAVPRNFTELGQSERYADHLLQRLEELARWVERNAGSQAVGAALEGYLKQCSFTRLHQGSKNLRRCAELHGRLLKRSLRHAIGGFEGFAEPRFGRRLRVGVVLSDLECDLETRMATPWFEHLDPECFEVSVFAMQRVDLLEGTPVRLGNAKVFELPENIEQQVASLRDERLDIAVFATDLAGRIDGAAQLAVHRVASLQVLAGAATSTSGLPEMDLFLAGKMTGLAEAGQFSERLALVPGPGWAFARELVPEEATTVWTRAALGLPADAVVFVAMAACHEITPEVQHSWAGLLAALPGAYLVIHPVEAKGTPACPTPKFCADFDRVIASHGVAGERLIVVDQDSDSRANVKSLLGVCDIFLDTFAAATQARTEALEAGLPNVVWEGDSLRSRQRAALLRSLQLGELIARDEASYRTIAGRLATDVEYRTTLRARQDAAIESAPWLFDTLAASDVFGDTLERTYDELVDVGPESFRAETAPSVTAEADSEVDELLQSGKEALAIGDASLAITHARVILGAVPNHSAARHLLGRAYQVAGQSSRAVTYLTNALPGQESDPELWFDIANALRENKQIKQALEALEGGLRLDPTRVEGWIMMAELAEAGGAPDIAREAIQAAQQVAPEDVRVRQMAVRLVDVTFPG